VIDVAQASSGVAQIGTLGRTEVSIPFRRSLESVRQLLIVATRSHWSIVRLTPCA